MTRDEWIEACTQRYMTVGGLEPDDALYFAGVCAESEEATNGPNVENWDSPADCADEDMSYWEDDE